MSSYLEHIQKLVSTFGGTKKDRTIEVEQESSSLIIKYKFGLSSFTSTLGCIIDSCMDIPLDCNKDV
jgi:hypothetical protein